MTSPALPDPPLVVVMGVSAVGKSTVAAALADALDVAWRDADDLHPAANVAKMSAGMPLDDADRGPWLDLVGEELADASDRAGLVVACSALRRTYRDRLRMHAPATVFVHLTGSRELLHGRASARAGHFMPASLLDSQLDTLEPLGSDEPGLVVDVASDIDTIIATAIGWLAERRAT
ncbi:gluconokinase [Agromyces sp. LHK192]|uniref:gluconokinase n=1 Tax=Agromyces sp. LHK192 TaxID=2498704 RepID=UPI001F0C8767|nr:gluconokinase [Agromyces sp. LHK192]